LSSECANIFRLNPVTGEITFGNFQSASPTAGHGSIPARGSELRALSYRYVASDARGNVSAGAVSVIRTPAPGTIAVTNPGTATGGSDEGSVEETKRRGPETLRVRDRAITAEVYEYLAREASTDVSKVRCLPERLFTRFDPPPKGVAEGDPWTYSGLNRDKGNVNAIIVPDASLDNQRPMPSPELLQEVSDYLEVRRTVTSVVHVTYARYLPINVAADVTVRRQATRSGLVSSRKAFGQELEAKIVRFLHPLRGGLNGKGWEIGQDLLVADLLEFIQPDP
jgi:predicted phage baseplate assembly protein